MSYESEEEQWPQFLDDSTPRPSVPHSRSCFLSPNPCCFSLRIGFRPNDKRFGVLNEAHQELELPLELWTKIFSLIASEMPDGLDLSYFLICH